MIMECREAYKQLETDASSPDPHAPLVRLVVDELDNERAQGAGDQVDANPIYIRTSRAIT
jgi:hypothetical protein